MTVAQKKGLRIIVHKLRLYFKTSTSLSETFVSIEYWSSLHSFFATFLQLVSHPYVNFAGIGFGKNLLEQE